MQVSHSFFGPSLAIPFSSVLVITHCKLPMKSACECALCADKFLRVRTMQLLDAGNVGPKKSEGILLCLSRQRTCTSLVKKNEKVKALSPRWEAFAPSNGHRGFDYSMTLQLFCLIFCSNILRRQPSIIQKPDPR